jgi:hypothetical protein
MGKDVSGDSGWEREPSAQSWRISRWSTSATMIKRYDERRSPYRSPVRQAIQHPGTPLRRAAVCPVLSICCII